MNTRTSVGLLAAGLLGLGVIAAGPSYAAAPAGFIGNTASSVAGCPSIIWRLANTNGKIHGMAYYSDLSGVSNVEGTGNQSTGQFSLTLTKTSIGNGPVGTVTGTREADGTIHATLTGEGCANNTVVIKPMMDLGAVASGRTGGGGGR